VIDVDKVLDDVVVCEINRRFAILVENLAAEGSPNGLKKGESIENFTRGFTAVLEARGLAKTVLTGVLKNA
jgi:hypothetical protein